MVCEGVFKFREIRKVDKGTFENDKGEKISYGDSYKLKVDEQTDKGIQERIFKISPQNVDILNQLKSVKPYTDIKIRFNVSVFKARVVLTPISLV